MSKTCKCCAVEKTLECFHACPRGSQGRLSYCKPCVSMRSRQAYAAWKAQAQPESCLYVAGFDALSNTYKVGHSTHPLKRVRELERGSPSTITLVACYPGLGHMENVVQLALEAYRTANSPCHEWFTVELGVILQTIEDYRRAAVA